mgnify:CR=1 FL=1
MMKIHVTMVKINRRCENAFPTTETEKLIKIYTKLLFCMVWSIVPGDMNIVQGYQQRGGKKRWGML